MFKVKKGFTVIEIAIVVAIVAVIAGVWYVSKNKAGADIKMPGIGNGGTTTTGGNTTPPKIGMGTIKGQVTDKDGKPVAGGNVNIQSGTCAEYRGGLFESKSTDAKGYFSQPSVPPGSYCVWANGYGYTSDRKDVGVTKGVVTTIDLKTTLKNMPY